MELLCVAQSPKEVSDDFAGRALTHIIISAFEEYDGLRGLYLPVVPSTVRL
jgi:hypothetical protein